MTNSKLTVKGNYSEDEVGYWHLQVTSGEAQYSIEVWDISYKEALEELEYFDYDKATIESVTTNGSSSAN